MSHEWENKAAHVSWSAEERGVPEDWGALDRLKYTLKVRLGENTPGHLTA